MIKPHSAARILPSFELNLTKLIEIYRFPDSLKDMLNH